MFLAANLLETVPNYAKKELGMPDAGPADWILRLDRSFQEMIQKRDSIDQSDTKIDLFWKWCFSVKK